MVLCFNIPPISEVVNIIFFAVILNVSKGNINRYLRILKNGDRIAKSGVIYTNSI
jgi:hypothetical protein